MIIVKNDSIVLLCARQVLSTIFFFNDTATTEIYTLSLHDALPIFIPLSKNHIVKKGETLWAISKCYGVDIITIKEINNIDKKGNINVGRSEEHTSELQSLVNLVCRLLLEKKKKIKKNFFLKKNKKLSATV